MASVIIRFCVPSSLALHHRRSSLIHPFQAEIQRRCCRFLMFCGQMLRRSTNVLRSVSSCRNVAGFQPGSCAPVAQNSSRVEANASTFRLSRTPSFPKNRCPRPRSMVQLSRQQERCSSKHHMHTQHSIDTSNSNWEYDHSPGFQCLIVTKTEGHGLLELDLLRAQTTSSREHPFPLFESTSSNQEA